MTEIAKPNKKCHSCNFFCKSSHALGYSICQSQVILGLFQVPNGVVCLGFRKASKFVIRGVRIRLSWYSPNQLLQRSCIGYFDTVLITITYPLFYLCESAHNTADSSTKLKLTQFINLFSLGWMPMTTVTWASTTSGIIFFNKESKYSISLSNVFTGQWPFFMEGTHIFFSLFNELTSKKPTFLLREKMDVKNMNHALRSRGDGSRPRNNKGYIYIYPYYFVQ